MESTIEQFSTKQDTESRDTYLKTILTLQQQQENVRSIDVAVALGYSRPSVCCAMKRLKEAGLVSVDEKSRLSLTPVGKELAEGLLERNQVLISFLQKLGANKALAMENACRMEHVITEEMYRIIKEKLNFA